MTYAAVSPQKKKVVPLGLKWANRLVVVDAIIGLATEPANGPSSFASRFLVLFVAVYVPVY